MAEVLDVDILNKRIKEKRTALGLTLVELASKVGVRDATIQRYESGEIKNIKKSTIVKLAKALNTTPAYLMGWEEDSIDIFSIPNITPIPKTKKIPLIGEIACGTPILAEQNITDYLNIDIDINCDFALTCKGNSMINARIFDGDIVLIKHQPDVENSEIAAVMIDGEATLKRVYKYPERIELRPENPTHEVLNYEGEKLKDITIIGKAIYFISKVI